MDANRSSDPLGGAVVVHYRAIRDAIRTLGGSAADEGPVHGLAARAGKPLEHHLLDARGRVMATVRTDASSRSSQTTMHEQLRSLAAAS